MGTLTKRSEVEKEITEAFGQVPTFIKQIPDAALPGFWALLGGYQMGETSIPPKYKELIGLAVAGSTRCRYCTLFHTEGAKLFGATDEEIAETNTLAGITMMGATFLNGMQTDYETFARETREMVAYARAHMPPPGAEAVRAAAH